MKKNKTILQNLTLLGIIITVFVACEKDFASIESDVVNSQNSTNFTGDKFEYEVTAYNKEVSPFQTNGLPVNLLGHYNDPVFGSATANFVSQMVPSEYAPNFGDNVVLDSVVLTIPYFSAGIETAENGDITYRLDSIYGEDPIKLSVYKNNYFLRTFNPNLDFNDSQQYFSNGSLSETNSINPVELEGQLLYSDENFLPSAEQIRLTTLNDEDEKVESAKLAPAIRVHLFDSEDPTDLFWQELIFDKEGEPELSNQSNFSDYFRGLYFKAETTGTDGTMMLLNFSASNANITLYYTSDKEEQGETDTEVTQESGTYTLNFSGNLVSIYDNNFAAIPGGNSVDGDEKLYLKGGQGSMAIINLFNGDENGESIEFTNFKNDFLDEDKDSKRLINEAFIEFYVDQSTVQGTEPDRIFLYDLKNNRPLIDYTLDQSVSDLTINAKVLHLPPLKRVDDEADGKGIKYKVRITEHINNIILRDSTNVKLGLVVTSNVGEASFYRLQDQDDIVESIPSGTILSPYGTVLYGNNTTENDKKVKLTIFYTEPEN